MLQSLPNSLVQAIKKFGFFHLGRSTGFNTALAYVALRRTCEIDWRSVPSSCYPKFSPYNWRHKNVGYRPAVKGGVKRREDGTEYCITRQEGLRPTWHAVVYKRGDRAIVLVCEFFESVDSA